jgi:dolichyl-phosphate-mannose--protein O-mannosyl transferase
MLFTRAFTYSNTAALFSGLLMTVENFFIIPSRYILGDIFIYCFGMAGLWLFLHKDRYSLYSYAWWSSFVGAGVLFGLAVGAKVSGALFPLVALGIALHYWRQGTSMPSWRLLMGLLVLLPGLVVFTLFYIHFSLLDPFTPVLNVIGEQRNQDDRTLRLFQPIRDLSLATSWGHFPGLVVQRVFESTLASLAVVASHVVPHDPALHSTQWWLWPFMAQPFILTFQQADNVFFIVYFFGNPLLWWMGLIALVAGLWLRTRGHWFQEYDVLLGAWGVNLLIMALLPRPVFIYHYSLSLLFLIVLLGAFLARMYSVRPLRAWGIMGLIVFSFVFFSPWTYGLPLTENEIQVRLWLPSWHPFLPLHLRYFPHISPP